MPVRCIRFATPDDVPAMLKIYTPYVEETPISFETAAPTEETFAGRLRDIGSVFPWLVYEEEGRVLGYAYATRFGARSGYDWTATTSVYVDGEAHQKGTGRALYNTLFALLAAQGYRRLYALVVTPNPESEGFHVRMGFEKEAVLHNVGCKFGKWLDVAYYAKSLLPHGENPPSPQPVSALTEQEITAALWRTVDRDGQA